MNEPLSGKLKIECNYFYKYEVKEAIDGLYKELLDKGVDKELLASLFGKWLSDVMD